MFSKYEEAIYGDKNRLKLIFNTIFFLFFIFVSFLSIMFLGNKLNFHKVLSELHLQGYFFSYLMKITTLKQVMIWLWGVNIIIFVLWYYINIKNTTKDKGTKLLINFLKDQEKSDKLLGYMITQPWGNIIWAGGLFSKIFRILPKDKGKDFLELLSSQDEFAISSEQIESIIANFKLKESSYIDLNITLSSENGALRLLYMAMGNVYVWQVMLIKKSPSIVEDSFINFPIPLVILGSRGRVLYINHEFHNLFKLPSEVDLESLEITDLIYEKEDAVDSIKFNWLPENIIVNRVFCKDINNNEFEGIVFQQNVYKENTNIIEYIRNIVLPVSSSEEDIYEALLLKNNNVVEVETPQYLEQLFDSNLFGVLVVDDDSNIIRYNQQFSKYFDIEKDVLNIEEAFAKTNFKNDIVKLLRDVNESTIEVEFEKDNQSRRFQLVKPAYFNNHQILYFIDITKNKDLEGDLRLLQRFQAIGQIASVVAHDFNNLLTAMMSFTYFAQEKQDEDDPVRLELEQIKQNAMRAKIMVRQLLTFSRKEVLKPVIFDVNSEVSDLMGTIVKLMGDRISSNFKRGKNVGSILMDKVQFHQIMTNLGANARDAMKKGGKLEIITTVAKLKTHKDTPLGIIPVGEYVIIELKDEGEGIKKESLKAIFQSHVSTKGDKGNGLGLYIVNKFIMDNAGFVDIKSIVGKGTSVFLYLPRYNMDEIKVVKEDLILEPKPLLDLTGSETILLVEDEAPVRMVCSRLLKSKGYNVIEADSGDEAIEMLKSIENIDLVVSDVMMPGSVSGPELIARIRDIFPNIKAILMSGYSEDILDDIDGDSAIKGIEFLSKPFTPDVFATKVRMVIKNNKLGENDG